MKQLLKVCIPFFLALGIVASIGWYLLVYDREFTRDMLIAQARHIDEMGKTDIAAKLYDLAYDYTGKDEEVAIELSNQYRKDGNYTKAEYTLTNAIADGGSTDLYVALCKTFVEQNKLMDAVDMLNSISDPIVKQEIENLRPAAPQLITEPGFYNEYVVLDFLNQNGTIYYTTNQEYPSTDDAPFTEPFTLPGGETVIYALRVDNNGLVSPLTIAGYTVSGVIEETNFADPVIELALRQQLNIPEGDPLMTNLLWDVTEFTVPADATVLSDLIYLPYLEKLTASDYRFDSLSFLTSLPNLKELDLSGCRFSPSELKYVAGLNKLEKLSLSRCSLSTIADLSGSTSLKYLDLSNNTLRNLEPLIPMTTLEELYLQHNAVTALDALMALTSLEKLDISYNSVTNIAPLAACTELTWLHAGYNQIPKLDGIDTIASLTHLYVNNNLLTDVDVLGRCIQLEELDISYNDISYILEFTPLVNLVKLNCSHNNLHHFPIWSQDSQLSVLDASHNKIGSVNPLSKLENLTYVYLDYNALTSLDGISECYRLVMVNAFGNEIHDVSKLTEHNIIVNYDPT